MVSQTRVLATLLFLLLGPTLASSWAQPDIRAARNQAEALVNRGNSVEAFYILEKALSDHPDSSGIKRDLEKARKRAADALAQSLRAYPSPDLPQQLSLLSLFRHIAPADPRLPAFSSTVQTALVQFQNRAEAAITATERGDPASAKEALPTLERLARVMPPSLETLRRLRVALKFYDAKSSAAKGETLAAIQALMGAEALGAPTEVAAQAYKQLETAELDRASAILESSSDPQSFADAAFRLGILVKNCDRCSSSSDLLLRLQSKFASQLKTAAVSYAPLGSAVVQASECALLKSLGTGAGVLLGPNGPSCAIPISDAIESPESLEVRVSPTCEAPAELLAEIAAATRAQQSLVSPKLISSTTVSKTAAPGRLVFTVDQCGVSKSVKNRQEIGSSYRAATTQVPNPEYAPAAQELADAKRAADYANQAASLNPGGGSLAAQIGALARLIGARKRLDRTPPMITQTIEASYSFAAYDLEMTARIAGDFRSVDESGRSRIVVPFNANASKSAHVIEGVNPADSRGNNNLSSSLPDDNTTLRTLWTDNASQLKSIAGDAVAGRMALSAAASMERRDLPAAASHLLSLTLLDAQLSDPDLLKLRSKARNNALLPAGNLAALAAPDLANFSRTHPVMNSAESTSQSQAGGRLVADQALDSVVLIVTDKAQGSGFFVRSDGLVLTNFHVVDGATLIAIKTRRGETSTARVVQYDKSLDVALLAVTVSNVQVAALSSKENSSIGQPVFALGAPYGAEFSATSGIVSALRSIGGNRWIQHDAPISPGSSGGPLIGADGRVLGVNTIKVVAESVEGLGFAITLDSIRKVLSF
jgi:S1-C subfamily serine protease